MSESTIIKGSSIGRCDSCNICNKTEGYICKRDGNFYSTGEYSRILKEFDISGVTFEQKIESVKEHLDIDTIKILKVLLQDNDAPVTYDTFIALEVIGALETIEENL